MSEDSYEDIKEAQEQEQNQEKEEPTTRLKGVQHLIELRRARVTELWAQGLPQYKIAAELHVTQPLISYDIAFLKQQARQQIKEFVTEKLPTTVSKVFVSLDLITAKAWETVANAEREHDERTKMQALSLINSVEAQKIEIVSNVGIVDQVITAAERLQQRQRDTVPQDLGELKEEENTVERNVQRDITDKSDTDITQPAAEDKPLFTRAKAIPLHPEDEEK